MHCNRFNSISVQLTAHILFQEKPQGNKAEFKGTREKAKKIVKLAQDSPIRHAKALASFRDGQKWQSTRTFVGTWGDRKGLQHLTHTFSIHSLLTNWLVLRCWVGSPSVAVYCQVFLVQHSRKAPCSFRYFSFTWHPACPRDCTHGTACFSFHLEAPLSCIWAFLLHLHLQ